MSLLRAFVDKLGGEVQVAVRRGAGRSQHWETSTQVEETVTGFDPEQGVVELEFRSGQRARLHFHEAELLRLLGGAGADGTEVWGQPLSDEEAAARFLTIHLEESIATRESHPSGWWEYEHGRFTPVPPWEAFARRRQPGPESR
ncbi:hypothetical protein [Blastococcus goldschmidtiae]|uniref:Uncharacterized protein n=1 Tax=Blastococcus goldschmidtiae TaxID=3075546 RepID=A0ABU2K868_9ACTN|nr:hypothetical protein [Blastococcus sp. DSM 46792]MDT0276375.1 hypothetical protein [Blastococcus sp. DSM 46792]